MDPELAKASGYKQLRLKDAEHVVPTLLLKRNENDAPQELKVPVMRSAYAKRQHQNVS
jgi:hypothetical protein